MVIENKSYAVENIMILFYLSTNAFINKSKRNSANSKIPKLT